MNTRLLASAALLTLAAGGASAQMQPAAPSPATPPTGGTTIMTTPAPPAATPPMAVHHASALQVTAPAPRSTVRHVTREPSYREPFSATASNIVPSDTHSVIAPQLPVPRLARNAGPPQFLRVADWGLQTNHTGLAQEAMERAETRLLDREITPSELGQPDTSPPVVTISEARLALGHGDIPKAQDRVLHALTMVEPGVGS